MKYGAGYCGDNNVLFERCRYEVSERMNGYRKIGKIAAKKGREEEIKERIWMINRKGERKEERKRRRKRKREEERKNKGRNDRNEQLKGERKGRNKDENKLTKGRKEREGNKEMKICKNKTKEAK
jgi:hypothetical protein